MKNLLIFLLLTAVISSGCAEANKKKWLSIFIDGVPSKEETKTKKEKTPAADIITIVKEMKRQEDGKWQSGHFPWKENMCAVCHKNDKPMPTGPALAELCFQCHGKEPFTGEKIHWPVQAGMCVTCHEPHRAKEKKLLKAPEKEICLQCHRPNSDKADIQMMWEFPRCVVCHFSRDNAHRLK